MVAQGPVTGQTCECTRTRPRHNQSRSACRDRVPGRQFPLRQTSADAPPRFSRGLWISKSASEEVQKEVFRAIMPGSGAIASAASRSSIADANLSQTRKAGQPQQRQRDRWSADLPRARSCRPSPAPYSPCQARACPFPCKATWSSRRSAKAASKSAAACSNLDSSRLDRSAVRQDLRRTQPDSSAASSASLRLVVVLELDIDRAFTDKRLHVSAAERRRRCTRKFCLLARSNCCSASSAKAAVKQRIESSRAST